MPNNGNSPLAGLVDVKTGRLQGVQIRLAKLILDEAKFHDINSLDLIETLRCLYVNVAIEKEQPAFAFIHPIRRQPICLLFLELVTSYKLQGSLGSSDWLSSS